MTKNETEVTVTATYISQLVITSFSDLENIEKDLLEEIHKEFQQQTINNNRKWKLPDYLEFWQISEIMLKAFSIKTIQCAPDNKNKDYDLLGIYVDENVVAITKDDSKLGIYDTSEDTFVLIAQFFKRKLEEKEIKSIIADLKSHASRVKPCLDRELTAVNNGIFHYDTKVLEDFSPDYVFLTKSAINMNFNAVNPIITMPNGETWDIETWMADLNDDPEITNLFWEITSALLRPNVGWDRAIFPASQTGNNGKGTLLSMWKALLGKDACCSISIAAFAKDFLIEPLIGSNAVLTDENPVGAYIDDVANFKAVITGDCIQINRKHKSAVSYVFHGLIVECLNGLPRVKDTSESFLRRLLIIPMTKCFTGTEIPEIKKVYLKRQDVLEYVMKKVLVDSNFYSLSEPVACKKAVAEYREFNDPVVQFWNELRDEFKWDLLPFTFLYDLYKAWNELNNPSGKPLGKTTFINDLLSVIRKEKEWICHDKAKQIRLSASVNEFGMHEPEPLILEYNLKDWMSPTHKGRNKDLLALPELQDRYRGIERVLPVDDSN